MQTTKTTLLLRQLSPTQFRKLGKMVRSPFFTTNDNLVTLYKYLQPHYPAFDSPKLEKQRVFQKVFPTHKYSDIKLRNLLREMTKLVEDLLIYQKLAAEEFRRKKMLAEIYHEQKQEKLFEKEMKQLQKLLHDQPYRDGIFYEAAFQLNALQLEQIQSRDLKRRAHLLQHTLAFLEQYYQLNKLMLKAEINVFSRFITSPTDANQENRRPVVVKIYEQILLLLDNRTMDEFFEIKQLLIGNLDKIRPTQQLNMLLYLINFGISQMRLDDAYYNAIVFELYQLGFDHGILVLDNHLSDHTFINTCITGAKAGAFDWVLSFVDQYESLLSASSRSEVKNLGLANIYFHQGDFATAIKLLDRSHFTNPLQQISARLHTLRCYYELYLTDPTYEEMLIDKTLAFEQSVRRNKSLSPEKRRSYFNFAQFLRQLAKERALGKLDQSTQQSFLKVLENQKITISRSWLMQKIKA